MMLVLLIAGIGFVLAGIVAIVFGIPVKEFSFGNTLMLIGAVSVCTGMILVGLAAVVGELKLIARRVAGRPVAEPRPRDFLPIPGGGRSGAGEGARLQDPVATDPAALPPAGAPWQDDAAVRARPDAPPPLGSIPTEAPPAARPRRNLLFSSTSRKDRDRAPTRDADPAARDVRAPGAPVAESDEAASPTFEGAWPRSERGRPSEMTPRRSGFPGSAAGETDAPAGATDRSMPARNEGPSGVTVIKSGVVDGMAYSLYSDGSIEAQMPEGMMRFASIDELRAHLDQRS